MHEHLRITAGRLTALTIWRALPFVFCALLAACTTQQSVAEPTSAFAELPRYDVEIRRTTFGIPHIKANDFGSLGYGLGYAYAEDNVCLLADAVLTVRGERSRFFGADGTTSVGFQPVQNIDSDIFFKFYIEPADLAAAYANGAPEIVALIKGYAAGHNRYLRDVGLAALPAPCRDAAWVRPVAAEDIYLLLAETAIQASGGGLLSAIANARPPDQSAAPVSPASRTEIPAPRFVDAAALGSNAYALGRELTANGRGLLVGNPHFPWHTTNRFYEIHLTIPGQLDVMGASLMAFPLVNIGFNHDVAWSHTVSTASRFTLYELTLVPGNPLAYEFDGMIETMQPEVISVDIKLPDGRLSRTSRTLYTSRMGPLLIVPALGLDWTTSKAFAIADAQRFNTRMSEQWLRINQAQSVAGIRNALATVQGVPWVNTIAADRTGDVLYADISVVPNVPDAKVAACVTSAVAQRVLERTGVPVLDGSRRHCLWNIDPTTPEAGMMPARLMPSLVREDYVLNSNDSFWLANARAPLTGYPQIIGSAHSPQSWRTRMGYKQLGELIDAKQGHITPQDLEAMLFSNRNYTAELIGDQLPELCGAVPEVTLPQGRTIDIRQACSVLAHWDRRADLESRGAALYREFWRKAQAIDGLWRVAFNPSQPLRTPHELNLYDSGVRNRLRTALAHTVDQFQGLGLPLDAPLGHLQHRPMKDGSIDVPGGDEFEGVLNQITFGPLTSDGYDNQELFGSSYIQVVTWNGHAPVVDALLTYSQSSHFDSVHYADQTELYARKAWVRLPFTEAEIARDPNLRTIHLTQ
jgi:acyl-homoserine-lactone acylase